MVGERLHRNSIQDCCVLSTFENCFLFSCLSVTCFPPLAWSSTGKSDTKPFESLKAVGFLNSYEKLKMLDVSVKDLGLTSNFVNIPFY